MQGEVRNIRWTTAFCIGCSDQVGGDDEQALEERIGSCARCGLHLHDRDLCRGLHSSLCSKVSMDYTTPASAKAEAVVNQVLGQVQLGGRGNIFIVRDKFTQGVEELKAWSLIRQKDHVTWREEVVTGDKISGEYSAFACTACDIAAALDENYCVICFSSFGMDQAEGVTPFMEMIVVRTAPNAERGSWHAVSSGGFSATGLSTSRWPCAIL